MVNADGPQELFVFALTRSGRVETTNYRTTRLPSDVNVPVYVKDEFPHFYRDLFGHHVEQERMRTVVLEHAWDMAWCDPCAADPLTSTELRELGVFWVDPAAATLANDVFVTRLHVRYDAARIPRRPGAARDRRPHHLPGPLRAAPRLAGRRPLPGGARLPRRACRRAGRRRRRRWRRSPVGTWPTSAPAWASTVRSRATSRARGGATSGSGCSALRARPACDIDCARLSSTGRPRRGARR